MAPPIWLDDHGQRQPTRLCPSCGKDEPVRRFRFDPLRMIGWKPLGTVHIVNWCGHGNEFVAWPEGRIAAGVATIRGSPLALSIFQDDIQHGESPYHAR